MITLERMSLITRRYSGFGKYKIWENAWLVIFLDFIGFMASVTIIKFPKNKYLFFFGKQIVFGASIKISEKDFERIMDMAQASGTLEKLNEAYDKDIDLMQGKIDKLTSQIQILKDKLSKTETFLKLKGLLEEFKESLKPKSVKSELKEKKLIVAEREVTRTKDEIQKRKGIAI